MQYGFVKTAALTPSIRVADCAYNARQIIEVLRGAAAAGAEIACLPELCITGYTCGDLFFNRCCSRARGTHWLTSCGIPPGCRFFCSGAAAYARR